MYYLYGEINRQSIKTRCFKSRAKAEKALSKILLSRNLQVYADRRVGHTEEFVCSYYTRFYVARA